MIYLLLELSYIVSTKEIDNKISMDLDTLSIILKYIDNKTITELFNNTYNICIKKEYYDRFYFNYSEIKEDHQLI